MHCSMAQEDMARMADAAHSYETRSWTFMCPAMAAQGILLHCLPVSGRGPGISLASTGLRLVFCSPKWAPVGKGT